VVSPRFLEAIDGPVGLRDRSYPTTEDGKVVAVDAPGHAPGHVLLIVFGGEGTCFLAGDSFYVHRVWIWSRRMA
jgi:glyoxylase-like metal-dependent hydrolase (beta-lactamase superfamily II)